ncbi:MAG: hypothetical protein QOE53_189 [Pseudonocardiales bacterium]|nr:hypothetical protein [Pseudonocardiales bacterium]
MNRVSRLLRRGLRSVGDDRGSTIPLILGFFLIGLLMVAGANAIDGPAARTQELTATLPLAAVQAAVQNYLAADPGRTAVSVQAAVSADGSTVLADCRTHTQLAFAGILGRSDGIEQHARSQAQGIVQ